MYSLFVSAFLACISADDAKNDVGQGVSGKPEARIGNVLIIGNTITQDAAIRPSLNFAPGQLLRELDLRVAEVRLNRRGIVRAKVNVKAGGESFKDVLVTIEEISTSVCRFEPGINSKGDPVIRFVFEERNFDPLAWPVSWEDFKEGRAFRGAGQRLRLELLQFNFVHGWLSFFPQLETVMAPPRGRSNNR